MESPHDTNRLRYFSSDLLYKVIKSKISSSVTSRNLPVETFVRIEWRILMSIAFLWLEIILYEVFLVLRESLLAFSQLSTPTRSQS